MNLHTNIGIRFEPLKNKLEHKNPVFLIGSCFSENIASRLLDRKWTVLSNPSGILFDTLSIERTVEEIVSKRKYKEGDMFLFNELYTSWNHHSDFSAFQLEQGLEKINRSIELSHLFLQQTSKVIITLGSAFSYYNLSENRYVANCHKVPQLEFRKELMSIDRIRQGLERIREQILSLNPQCEFILTISPVRHLRDGVVDNNRSKARLIEAVNLFTQEHPEVYYFPSYEIVIDVLRDYRYFDIDFAHPNYLATDIVFEYFKQYCVEESSFEIMEEFFQLHLARKHRSKNPETIAHKKFLTTHLEKARRYQAQFPKLDFSGDIFYFEQALLGNIEKAKN